jgi:hypothetical protein
MDAAIAAVQPTTASVLGAIAGATVGAVGTYALAWLNVDVSLNPGHIVSGSDLIYANDGGTSSEAGRSTTVLSGAWQLMGSIGWRLGTSGFVGSSTPHKTSLWLRIV